jgi:hypothetical protein
LQDCLRPERRDDAANVSRLMPDNNQSFCSPQRLAGTHNVLDQGAPAGAVQHLRELGTQPRPFSRSKNDDDTIRGSHLGLFSPSLQDLTTEVG